MTTATKPEPSYLALMPWDIDRWRNSDAYEELSLAEQGAYLNLCFRAWQEQPGCLLPNDDTKLWRKANARSKAEWLRVKKAVLKRWETTPDGHWIWHKVVLDMFQDSKARYERFVEAGRTAGRASARARHNLNKDNERRQRSFNDRSTTVERPSDDRSTTVNPSYRTVQEGIGQEGIGQETDPIGVVGGRALESPPGSSNGRPPASAADLIREAHAQGAGHPGEFEAPPEVVKARQKILDHDPKNPLEVRVVLRCIDLADKVVALETREATAQDARDVLTAISGTKGGKSITVIRGASTAWLETTLVAADAFERDLLKDGADLDLLDLAEPPEEEANPPPRDRR